MPLVLADEREAEDVRGEDGLLVDPAREVAPEAARVGRVVSALVFVAELCEAGFDPVADGPAHGVLVHVWALLFSQMKAVLPSVAQARGPVAGHRVRLVPEIVVNREPAALAQRLDRAPDVAVAHAFDDLVLDVEDEAARRLQRFEEWLVERHEPLDELVRVYAVVVPVARVRVGRRGDDQVRLALVSLQLLAAVAADHGARGVRAPDCGSTHGQTHPLRPLRPRLLDQNAARRSDDSGAGFHLRRAAGLVGESRST